MTATTRSPAVLTVDTTLPDAGYVNPPLLVLHAPRDLYLTMRWQHYQTSDEVVWGVQCLLRLDRLTDGAHDRRQPRRLWSFCMAYIRDQANPRDGGALGTDHLQGAWSSNPDAFNRAMGGWCPELIEAVWNSTRIYVEVAWARSNLPHGWTIETDSGGRLVPASELYPVRR